jgi:membrane protein YdbS with pleckstrin-like domain
MASRADGHVFAEPKASFAKRMSTHVAYALVVYTLLLIFEVSPQMESKGMSILPYFILVALVAMVIMPCRYLEHRWKALDDGSHGDLTGLYRREVVGLWLCAIGIPTALMLVIWIIP